jgi:hypothetical protein
VETPGPGCFAAPLFSLSVPPSRRRCSACRTAWSALWCAAPSRFGFIALLELHHDAHHDGPARNFGCGRADAGAQLPQETAISLLSSSAAPRRHRTAAAHLQGNDLTNQYVAKRSDGTRFGDLRTTAKPCSPVGSPAAWHAEMQTLQLQEEAQPATCSDEPIQVGEDSHLVCVPPCRLKLLEMWMGCGQTGTRSGSLDNKVREY